MRRAIHSHAMKKVRKQLEIRKYLLDLDETFILDRAFKHDLNKEVAAHTKILNKLVPSLKNKTGDISMIPDHRMRGKILCGR